MRSNKPKTIEISVVRGRTELPAYLSLFQRHFEKSIPTTAALAATVNAPIDQLGLLMPVDLLDGIVSIEVEYRRGA
jgi:hypothetical protein